jgi:hypothetical protein
MPRRLPILSSVAGCDRHAISRGQAAWLSIGSAICSGLLMYLFDPERGRHRRHMLRDMGLARLRRAGRGVASAARGAEAEAYGLSHRVLHLVPTSTDVADDETLCQRVESQLFRDRHIPKGNLNITAEHGTVILRGELDSPAEIAYLVERVQRVAGVRAVHNLLHPHGTPAPNKQRSRMAGEHTDTQSSMRMPSWTP